MLQMTMIGRTVLVVDHEPTTLRALPPGLVFFGFNVFSVSTGEEAVALLQARSETISVALVNLRLRGMDGLETVRALREVQPCLPCWIMSPDQAQNKDLPQPGIAGVISKPVILVDLVRLLVGQSCPGTRDARKTVQEQDPHSRRDEASGDNLIEAAHISALSISHSRIAVSG